MEARANPKSTRARTLNSEDSEIMDLSILGPIATFVVAIITLFSILTIRRQLRLMEKQVVLQRSEVYPFLNVEEKRVDGNKVELKLKNKGKGPAIRVGLAVSFWPLKLIESNWEPVEDLSEFENGKAKRIYPTVCIVFLKDPQGLTTLHPLEESVFAGEVLFAYNYSKKEKDFPRVACLVEGLRKLFVANNRRFLLVGLRLVYRDISESVTESEPLYLFVIDFQKHKSVEEAIKDAIPLPPHSISLEEVGYIDGKSYDSLKSQRAFAENRFKD
jgi:hypothetical protein